MRSIPFGKPIVGIEEKTAVAEVLDSGVYVHGPKTKAFDDAFATYTGSSYTSSVASCTAGMHLVYFALGLKPGDEVIVPAQTHTATAHAVELCGAKPVFADAEISTGNIDLDHVETLISPQTKAISVVHYLGMPVDMGRVMSIAAKHNLFVLEDCALAIGTYYNGNHAGTIGDVGSFSFYPVKHMTTAEGGMLTVRDEGLIKQIILKKAFGVDRTVYERKVPGEYDVVDLGFNYRMNEIEAAIGLEQLKRIDGFLETRKQNYNALTEELRHLDEILLFNSSTGPFQSSHYCHSILLGPKLADKRVQIMNSLKQHGIGVSIYYPGPVPLFTYYREKYGYSDSQFPVAKQISDTIIALPVGPHLDTTDMNYIGETLKQIISEYL